MEIEKIVTTQYKVDGILFDTYEQAERWKVFAEKKEEEQKFFKMYDDNGEVNNAKLATFVYLKGAKSAKGFIEQAKKDDSVYDGIEEDDTGLFFWDGWCDQYREIDPETLQNAYKIYKTFIKNIL